MPQERKKLNCETVQIWRDEFLTWTPEDYGGIRTISMPPSYIWTPDIELYNRHNMLWFYYDCIRQIQTNCMRLCDRFWWNLVQRCILGLSIWRSTKNFKIPKSKMADGGHLENQKSRYLQNRVGRLWWNFAWRWPTVIMVWCVFICPCLHLRRRYRPIMAKSLHLSTVFDAICHICQSHLAIMLRALCPFVHLSVW